MGPRAKGSGSAVTTGGYFNLSQATDPCATLVAMESMPGTPATDDGTPRRERALTVHRPWAWCWWPVSHPLVLENPDVTENRLARTISGMRVDWGLITDAVRYAVGACPVGPEALQMDDLTVDLPFGLSDEEYDIAQSWVSDGTPVLYRYEDDVLEDGRHRLWLSRGHIRGEAVPVLASNLLYLRDALTVMPELTPTFVELTLPGAAAWWATAPADLCDCNAQHRKMLAYAYAEVSVPQPIPADWFGRLASWDRHLETLVDLRRDGRADTALINVVLPGAWRYRQDDTCVDHLTALELFRAVHGTSGFSMRSEAFPRPRGSLTLFRGATAENRHGLSWSADPATARYFATDRQAPQAYAELWKVRVPADRCLMFFPDEDEFIVDLAGLEHLVRKAPPTVRAGLSTRVQVAWLKYLEERRI